MTSIVGSKVSPAQNPRKSNDHIAKDSFFCWRLLGLIPGGTPFSQLNKDVRDVMSATTKKRCETSSVCKNMQKATGTNKFQTQKRSQSLKGRKEEGSGEIQRKAPMPEWEDATKEEGFGETRRKHLCRSQKCACNRKGQRFKQHKVWWPLKEVFVGKPNLRQRRSARKTLKQFQSRR